MNFIEKIFLFFKKAMRKEKNVLLLESPKDNKHEEKKSKFLEKLKVDNKNKEKKKVKVETLTCAGDGLGIQGKINY